MMIMTRNLPAIFGSAPCYCKKLGFQTGKPKPKPKHCSISYHSFMPGLDAEFFTIPIILGLISKMS